MIFCRKSKISRHDVSLVSPNIAKSRLKVALFHNDLCTKWKKKYLKALKFVSPPQVSGGVCPACSVGPEVSVSGGAALHQLPVQTVQAVRGDGLRVVVAGEVVM